MKSALLLLCVAAVLALGAGAFAVEDALAVGMAATLGVGAPAPRIKGLAPQRAALSADAQALLDVSPDACVVLTRDGLVLWANRAAREQFGTFTAGDPFSFTMRVPELIRAVELAGRTGRSEQARWSEKVPTSLWFEAFIAPCQLAAGDGAPRDVIVVFVRDLTEQQRLHRMREDFVANASHELRTPLAALSGFIETLQGPAKDDPVAREKFLGVMQGQAERMKRLSDALLSLSRIEMRAHVRPAGLTDIAATARNAVELTRSLSDDAGVPIELNIVDEPLTIRGDADELVQLFANLVENAIKYGGEGGRVVVGVASEPLGTGMMAVVSVQDFGVGIAPEHVPRLTERFYRVDVEASRARQGTGLGLAIVKHIVARHRGRLMVRSELGAGSTFTVKIPLEQG
ncbi:MAG: ATP-binding protein [Acuticoccus sp.]